MKAFTIILADDHPAFMEGVSMKIEREEGLSVIATATNGKEALEMAIEYEPDLLLIDMDMPEMTGLEVTMELSSRELKTKVLPLSGHSDPEYVLGTLENGAEGYLMKDEPLSVIVRAIRTVLEGGVFISSRVSQQIVTDRLRRTARKKLSSSAVGMLVETGFTPKLLEILQLTSEGLSNEQIAEKIFRSEHTVRNQIDSVKTLVGVRWRPALVAWAWRNGVNEIDMIDYREIWELEDLRRRDAE